MSREQRKSGTKQTASEEVIVYHPSDTSELLKGEVNFDHSWYVLNFNQLHMGKKGNSEAKKAIRLYTPEKAKEVVRLVLERQNEYLASCEQTHLVKVFDAQIANTLIHGLGGPHVRETNLTLHQVYGVPYIPSSSVKGILRHWCSKVIQVTEPNETMAQLAKKLFGSEENRGSLQISDMHIVGDWKLGKGVLTPHFAEYYAGKGAPTDDQNPIPIQYYTVENGKLRFYVMLPKKMLGEITEETLIQLVKKGLTEMGVGSKTAVGYGAIKSVVDVTDSMLKEKRMEIENKKQTKLFATLSDEDILIHKISQLSSSQADIEVSKKDYFEQIMKNKYSQAAKELRNYWMRENTWSVNKNKKKQFEKVQAIKTLLV